MYNIIKEHCASENEYLFLCSKYLHMYSTTEREREGKRKKERERERTVMHTSEAGLITRFPLRYFTPFPSV